MAWSGTYNKLQMAEGDFGIGVPFTIHDVTIGENDSLKFTFKETVNGETILIKDYSDVSENTVSLSFTEEETALFSPGNYVFSLDWYQSGNFMCNLIEVGKLKVGDKA